MLACDLWLYVKISGTALQNVCSAHESSCVRLCDTLIPIKSVEPVYKNGLDKANTNTHYHLFLFLSSSHTHTQTSPRAKSFQAAALCICHTSSLLRPAKNSHYNSIRTSPLEQHTCSLACAHHILPQRHTDARWSQESCNKTDPSVSVEDPNPLFHLVS